MPIIPVRDDKISATYIVAAPDSTNPNRADFKVPQGSVNAEQTINQAISELGPNGGKILLLDGTFTISAPIVLINNVTLEGIRESTTITIPDGLDTNINAIENDDPTGGNDNLTVLNINLNLNKGNQTTGTMNCIRFDVCYNVRIARCRTGFARNNGIRLQGGNQLTVVECRNDNNTNDGILVNNTDGVGLYQNLVYLNGNNGIELDSLNRPSIVSGNSCIQNSVNGIGVFNLTRATISENVVRNNGDQGIVTFSANYCSINNNGCFDNTSHGINLIQSNLCLVDGNNSSSNVEDGLVLDTSDNCTVSNNEITENERHGINIFAGSYNNIVGNIAVNNSFGNTDTSDNMLISGTSTDSAEFNNIQENKVRSGGTARYGINLSSNAFNNQTTNNDFRDGGVTSNFRDVEGNPTSPGNIPGGGAGVTPVGVIVEMQGTQTYTDYQIADVNFDTELFDNDNMWDSGAPASITVNTAGIYLVTAYASWSLVSSPVNGGAWYQKIELNGSVIQRSDFHNNASQDSDAGIEEMTVTAHVNAAAGDTINFELTNFHGSNNDLVLARLSAFKVAGT